jgi:GAF domain-containing protein
MCGDTTDRMSCRTTQAVANAPTSTDLVDFLAPRRALQNSSPAPDLPAQIAAYHELSKILVESPRRATRRLLEIALGLCHAGSAGISLLRHGDGGEQVEHWDIVSGALAVHEGTDTARSGSPCGLCLDCGYTILLSRPERVFASLGALLEAPLDAAAGARTPPIVEQMLVPLYDAQRRQLGALWLVHHDSTGQFSSADARILEHLATHLLVAFALLEHERESRQAQEMAQACERSQETVVNFLVEERRRREHAEAAALELRRTIALKDALIRELQERPPARTLIVEK